MVPSSRSLPNSASSLMSPISSMHLGFQFLLLLPFLALLLFGGSVPVQSHVFMCCCFSSSFLCDCFQTLVSPLLLCQLYLHVQPAFWHWLITSIQFLIAIPAFRIFSSIESLNERIRRALATLNVFKIL